MTGRQEAYHVPVLPCHVPLRHPIPMNLAPHPGTFDNLYGATVGSVVLRQARRQLKEGDKNEGDIATYRYNKEDRTAGGTHTEAIARQQQQRNRCCGERTQGRIRNPIVSVWGGEYENGNTVGMDNQ